MKLSLFLSLLLWTVAAVAADVPIKNLPQATSPLSLSDSVVLEQLAGTRLATLSQLQTTFFSGLAPSATIDTTNASNISHGTLALGLFPGTLSSNTSGNAATATAFASTPSLCPTGMISTGIDLFGNANCSTISATSVSGLAPSATVDTTNASNITSGSLSIARLPAIAGGTILGNSTGSTGAPTALTALPPGLTTVGGGAPVGDTDAQVLTGKLLDGGSNTFTNLPAAQLVGSLNIASLVGQLGVPNGGTGLASGTASQALYFNTTTTLTSGVLPAAGGGTGLSAPTDNTTLVGSGTAWVATTVPSCLDSIGQHLNFDPSTNTFSCGTSSNVGIGGQDLQTFSTSGTWTKPSGNPKSTHLICNSAGGGGGGGVSVTSGTAGSGGGAGGSGFQIDTVVAATSLGATETVTIGAGGTSGTAGVAGAGGNGGNGGSTTFTITAGPTITVPGSGGGQGGAVGANTGGGGSGGAMTGGSPGSAGGGGAGGVPGGAAGGSNSGTLPTANLYGAGGGGDSTGSNGAAGANSAYGPTGGGAGAGLAASPVALSGGSAGHNIANPTGNGTVSAATLFGGLGGSGGNSAIGTNTAASGTAGARGGGGGGGGAALTTGTAGAGGAGGNGFCAAITSF